LAKACDAGITASCGKLGVLFDSGNGVAPNKARAFTLFDGACSRSDMTACYNQARLASPTPANAMQRARP
jgi:TPR repeat protein